MAIRDLAVEVLRSLVQGERSFAPGIEPVSVCLTQAEADVLGVSHSAAFISLDDLQNLTGIAFYDAVIRNMLHMAIAEGNLNAASDRISEV